MKQAQMNELRKIWMEIICNFLEERGEEVLIQNSGCVAFPTTLGEEEGFVRVKIEIPSEKTCAEDSGDDPYTVAEAYRLKCAENEEKKRIAEEKKQKKIAEDKKKREAKKAEREAKMAKSREVLDKAEKS